MKQQNHLNKKEQVGGVRKLGNKIKSADIFGEGVGFNIGGGSSTHQTYFGSLLTLVVLVITGTYTFKKYTVMSGYQDTVFQTSTQLEPFTKDSPLRQDESNFNLLLNLFIQGKPVDKLDGYIELKFFQYGISRDEDDKFVYEYTEIGLHSCNQDDRSHFNDESDLQDDFFKQFGEYYE